MTRSIVRAAVVCAVAFLGAFGAATWAAPRAEAATIYNLQQIAITGYTCQYSVDQWSRDDSGTITAWGRTRRTIGSCNRYIDVYTTADLFGTWSVNSASGVSTTGDVGLYGNLVGTTHCLPWDATQGQRQSLNPFSPGLWFVSIPC